MLRKIWLLFVGLIIVAGCSKQGREIVEWKPRQPGSGDKITIIYHPQRLEKIGQLDLNIFMVYQLIQDQTLRTFKIPMTAKKQSWQASLTAEPGTFLLRVKFEDQLDRVEDNDGLGWNVIVRDDKNNIIRNTHHKLGKIFSLEKYAKFPPNYTRSYNEFNQELSLYPDNYGIWFDFWSLKLQESNWSKQQLQQAHFQLDSLLKNSEQSADLLILAFNTNWKLLKDQKTAIEFGEKILSEYANYSNKDEIEFSMIFLKGEKNPETIINELIKFTKQAQNSELLKSAYYQLGISFQNFQMLDEAIHYFQKYIELIPEDISLRLNLANLLMRKQNYEKARQMIAQARDNSTDEIYLQSNPWEHPSQRRMQLNLYQCQILSTQATLETALHNYKIAAQIRKQVVELGTPFPAFEWSKIGDIYFQLEKLDSAQQAYIKAVSVNPEQQDAIQKLKFIYQRNNNNLVGFDSFLDHEIAKELKAAARPAPDFGLTDLNGELFRLSEQTGKIVVLTFWDSWSSACQQEIPQLNGLVEEFKDNPEVIFWAISVEAPVSINKFIRKNPFHFHHFHTGYDTKKLFKVIGFPTHFLIDPDGKIRYTHVGYTENIQNQLKKEIVSILNEGELIS